ENPTTAPVRDVVITDQLDMGVVDLATFSLGPVGFGASQLTPAAGLTDWTGVADLRPRRSLIVRVTGHVDLATGLVTWHFSSLDPATGLPTTDPANGFVPVNSPAPAGEGSVTFTVRCKSSTRSGARTQNSARIVLDGATIID